MNTLGSPETAGWRDVLRPDRLPSAAVLFGGILLHSMNILLLATVLPSIVGELGGAALMSWPTTAFLAGSIVTATATGLAVATLGPRGTYTLGALGFGAGALWCTLAPSMAHVIAGRLVQGAGGGLIAAVAYVLVRHRFPAALWPRVFALLAGAWSISVLVGPLVGGVFASHGHWRSAFGAVSGLAAALALAATWILPRTEREAGPRPAVPWGRLALACAGIAGVSLAAAVPALGARVGTIVLAVAALVTVVRLDRTADTALLPRDAFSPRTVTGSGLWLALLVSIAFSPLQIYLPLLLQGLHGLTPLEAGYAVATASLAWTSAAIGVAGLSGDWPDRLLAIGPVVMATGLAGLAALMPAGPIGTLVPVVMLVGAGIGMSWAFTAQRVMAGARPGDESTAAASVATVQQIGIALGAAGAGLVANSAGLSRGTTLDADVLAGVGTWVPATFAPVALLAGVLGLRLLGLRRRGR